MIQVKGLIRPIRPLALHEIYRLPATFIGDGTNYIDTGLKLFENPSLDFTLLLRADRVSSLVGDRVYTGCFSENQPYRGVLIRNDWANDETEVSVLIGQLWSNKFAVAAPSFTVAVRKTGQLWDIFIDGVQQVNHTYTDQVEAFADTLLIGAQWDSAGQIFRRSQTTVRGLAVFDTPLSDTDLQAQLAAL